MNFFDIMESIGIESLAPKSMTLEDELMEEITLESELDRNFAEMEAMNTIATADSIESISVVLAEREIGLESNQGRDASVIFQEFGLEAIKDVAARKFYGGMASIKALINTCISWLKNLLGIATSSKKIFMGLKKKADNQLKALRKLASKNMEKLKRDMADYGKIFDDVIALYDGVIVKKLGNGKGSKDAQDVTWEWLSARTWTASTYNSYVNTIKNDLDALKTAQDELSDKYDRSDKDEYEEGEVYSHIITALEKIKAGSDSRKSDTIMKSIDKSIKNLEKVRDNALKDTDWAGKAKNTTADKNGNTRLDGMRKLLNQKITLLNRQSMYAKNVLKIVVRLADDALTDAKAIEAALV